MTMPKGWNSAATNMSSSSVYHSELKGKEVDIKSEGKKKALIIGVSSYANNLQPLEFCQKDGEEMYQLLKSLGYEIEEDNKLIGEVKWEKLRQAIIKFFTDKSIKSKDTLLFYFSGHGIPDGYGDTYIATSEVDPDAPFVNGYSFDDLTKMMYRSVSKKVVMILDCCCSGSATITKGSEEEAANLARDAINNKSKILKEGEGKCLLAASLPAQAAYGLKEKDHSIFTYHLLEGLKGGNGEAIDNEGRVTPYSLGSYVYDKVTEIHPKQKPLIKAEAAGKIILAHYPKLTKESITTVDISQIIEDGKHYLDHKDYENALKLFNKAIAQNPRSAVAYFYNGTVLHKLKNDEEAIKSYDKALEINPKYFEALTEKGLSLEDLKRYNEAAKCFDEADKIKPKDPKILKYKERIDIMISKPFHTSNTISSEQDNNSVGLNDREWEDLLYAVNDKECIPVIGAGACDPWLPLGSNLARRWAEEYRYPLEDSYDLSRVAQFLSIENGDDMYPKHLLSRELERIDPPDFSLEEYKNTPYAVLADLNLPIYITTNYDHFIEEALRSRGKEPISDFCRWSEKLVEYANDLEINSNLYDQNSKSKITPSNPLVYHLHGDIDYPQSMVLTESDYRNFVINLNKNDEKLTLPLVVRRAVARSSLMFLGYNLQAINFRAINDGLLSIFRGIARPPSLVVQPPPPLLSYDEKAKVMNYLQSHSKEFGMRLYCGNLSEFIIELRQYLDKFKQ
jgi:tetratricopeptide (TPR) repeat protein